MAGKNTAPLALPRAARFDFPAMRVDQYGLPDTLVAAIKSSLAFGGAQLESRTMQMELDLHALATLRTAVKAGDRMLHSTDGTGGTQRTTPKAGTQGADPELDRLLAMLPQADRDTAQDALDWQDASGSPSSARGASPPTPAGAEGPTSRAGKGHGVSDSGHAFPQGNLQQRATTLAEMAAAAAAAPVSVRLTAAGGGGGTPSSAQGVLSPGAGPSSVGAGGGGGVPLGASLHVRRSSYTATDMLQESENAQISRHMQKLLDRRASPSPVSPEATSPWTPGVGASQTAAATQRLPPPASPTQGRPQLLHTSSNRLSPSKPLTMRSRAQLMAHGSAHELLAAAATETGAGLHACLPSFMMSKPRRPSVSGGGPADDGGASPMFGTTVFRSAALSPSLQQQQLSGRQVPVSAPQSGETGAGADRLSPSGAVPTTPSPYGGLRPRRASHSSYSGHPSIAPTDTGKRSLDDTDYALSFPQLQLPQLPSTTSTPAPGTWNMSGILPAAAAMPRRTAAMQSTRTWRA